MDGIKIERAVISDAPAILELQKLAFQSEAEIHRDHHISPLMETIDHINKDFLSHDYYKAIAGQRIIGSVRACLTEGNILQIGRLIVHPGFQNRGIGKMLMHHVEHQYTEVSGYHLFTAEKSIRNTTFYSRLGYKACGTFEEPANKNIVLVKFEKTGCSN